MNKNMNIRLGKQILFFRKQKGLTQAQLAEQLGISFQQQHKYETGQTQITVSRLQHIASCLEVPITEFFKETPGTNTTQGMSLREASIIRDFRKMPSTIQSNIHSLVQSFGNLDPNC
jgi:transcriptional regulator with XRE-family HTH domain